MILGLSEAGVEEASLDWFKDQGYQTLYGEQINPEGPSPERVSFADVILIGRLRDALNKLNPTLDDDTIAGVIKKIMQSDTPSLIEENRRLHHMLVDGVDIEVTDSSGEIRGDKARIIDFEDVDNNDWLAVNQFTVIENKHNRRPDIVVFINGLPLGVLELKKPGDENATLGGAHNQLQVYKNEIPSLFRTNAVLGTSDGIQARLGSLTANVERFMPWRTVDGENITPKGWPELGTLIDGVFEKRRFLDYVRGFIVFEDDGGSVIKKIAGYHQFHAVLRAVQCTVDASKPDGDRRVGVIWHTQGSGKSLLMVFYAGRVVVHPDMENPTIVVITDRNDLDDQLFGTFSGCTDLIRQKPQQANDREALIRLLKVSSGGVIFTTIQKFMPEKGEVSYPMLTDRRNVIVIADEAHRSQYGFKSKLAGDTGDISQGFATHLRSALPNASFIGFTGTPVESSDRSTPAVFGNYIDVYDIQRGVEDGATVPIYYESRLARIQLKEDEKPKIDAEIDELVGEEDEGEKLKGKWSRVEALVGSKKRLSQVAKDIVEHFESRVVAMDGKAMIVCMSRRICIKLYNEIINLRPDWHSDDPDGGEIKVVMTGSATDPVSWQKHIGGKKYREGLAKRLKKPSDPLKLVLVRDMWLTGFDAPCMHTMYVDKPMKGHGLMQAIARVNRVFKDKPGGLIVDYIGLAQNLKNALAQYSDRDRDQTGIDESEAIALMVEKYEVVKDMFHGFGYANGIKGTSKERLIVLAQAMEWVLELQRHDASQETREEDKKRAWRRYPDAVLTLTKAFALAAASDEARAIRDEVGFFQSVRAALVKTGAEKSNGKNKTDLDVAVQQIVDGAVASTEIVDILQAAGVESADISVLSDEFLAEVQDMKHKNLAMEALRKLLNGEIKSQAHSNVVQSRAFSERLQQAVNKYHNNAITTAQVIEELIALAKDVKAARERGEEDGLSPEEVAFYDALANNESARDVLGDEQLKVIAHELLLKVQENTTIDWQHNENARARIRVLVKRILRKYGYPPDLQDSAVKLVLEQAEALSAAESM